MRYIARIVRAAKELARDGTKSSEPHVLSAAPSIDDVNKSNFLIVVLEKYPIQTMNDALERRIVTVIGAAKAGIVGKQFTEMAELGDKFVCSRAAKTRFDIDRDCVGIINE